MIIKNLDIGRKIAWWAAVYGVAESGTTETTYQQQQQQAVLKENDNQGENICNIYHW